MKRRYNRKLFILGFLMNIVRLFFIVIPALVLIVVGIRVKPCLIIGLALLAIVLIIALVQQLMIKHTAETSDDPNFDPFAEAMCSDDWQERFIEMTYKKAEEQVGTGSTETAEEEPNGEEK